MKNSKWKWIYNRVGQMLCFSFGTLGVLFGLEEMPYFMFGGVIFLCVALILRHQMYASGRDKDHLYKEPPK